MVAFIGESGITFTFTFMYLADAFIQSDLQLHSGYTFFVSIYYKTDIQLWKNA